MAEMYVTGLRYTLRAARKMGPEIQQGVRREMRDAVEPTVADIKARFVALGPNRPGRCTAQTVRGSFGQNFIELRMGGRGGPAWGFELGVEFGAKDRLRETTFVQNRATGAVRVTRRQNYSKNFGLWTGNQWTLERGKVSGNAFYPAIRDHYEELMDSLVAVIDRTFDQVVRAAA